jgi:2-iminoacetate synthase
MSSIQSKTKHDVEQALGRERCDWEDFKALISPAAAPYLEHMAQKSHQLTLKRFGSTMQLYIPMYLSNICYNSCVYCGFNHKNEIQRRILTDNEIIREAEAIKALGNFEHILLVTGESPRDAGLNYLKRAIRLVKSYFSQVSLEVQPLSQQEYEELVAEGLHTVYIYQETYNRERYPLYHPAGKKRDFEWRLETPDRLGSAGIYRTGIGALIGLEDWRTECAFMALHLQYLEKYYWQTRYSIAFPRLRPFAGGFQPNSVMTDRELVQVICAFRLFNGEVELSISTRESETLRNNLVKLGITALSAGSKTNPGGYVVEPESLEQFAINDDRSPCQVTEMLRRQGYEPVWKDWERAYYPIK